MPLEVPKKHESGVKVSKPEATTAQEAARSDFQILAERLVPFYASKRFHMLVGCPTFPQVKGYDIGIRTLAWLSIPPRSNSTTWNDAANDSRLHAEHVFRSSGLQRRLILKGYVLFKTHGGAEACVKAGGGQWSQHRPNRKRKLPAYPHTHTLAHTSTVWLTQAQ
eukprot:5339312-Amphidinium_carterae.1